MFYVDDMFQGTNPVELTDVHLRLTALRRGQPPIEGPALLETCLGIIPGWYWVIKVMIMVMLTALRRGQTPIERPAF